MSAKAGPDSNASVTAASKRNRLIIGGPPRGAAPPPEVALKFSHHCASATSTTCSLVSRSLCA